MKLLFLFGEAAVGKMTVGQELCKITDFRLFHNHITIEPVLEVFGTLNRTVVDRCRWVFFEEFAKSDNYGMIFSFMWAFDDPHDWDYVERVKEIFRPYDTEFYYAELVAPEEIRLQRNVTENRLNHKASKRDIEASTQRILRDSKTYRFISNEGEIPFENYIRIDNSLLSAEEAARRIKERFGF